MCEAWETGARALGKFCYLVRSQILSFFFDNAKVRKIQSTSKLFLKKARKKARSDLSRNVL
jgi:hypothetical protein